MKLMKAMKKLKFWSAKKNKKKNKKSNNYYHNPNLYYQTPYYPLPPPPPPPPPRATGGACQCHFCQFPQPVEPSAPPLPPWFDEGPSGFNWADPSPNRAHPAGDQSINISQEIVVKTSTQLLPSSSSSSSYQQYLDPNPDYDLQRREKSASGGLFGCGLGVGSFLIRCFFPCFHISEAKSR